MSEERKPVVCRYCGHTMQTDEGMSDKRGYMSLGYYCPECAATSPATPYLPTHEEAEEAAYAAATRTTPNRPLTLPALFEMETDDAVWVVSENGRIWAMGEECAQEWASEEHCLFFARKPTPADIAAARAGKGEGNAD